MEKILYFDCISGISGDMVLAALLDMGIDKDKFLRELSKLNLDEEFEFSSYKKMINGIEGTHVDIILKNKNSHVHRNLEDIYKIIEGSKISDRAKYYSKNIFMEIAMAEAKVHGTTIDRIHFHEVGAIDSIVDIVGASILIDMINPSKIYSSPVALGSGFVKCEHGLIPVPAPATLEILKGAKIRLINIQDETTTPTGAAIVKSLCDEFIKEGEFDVSQIGYGIGTKIFSIPNMLRVVTGSRKENSQVYEINANIDDMNSEVFSYIYEKMLNMGALDVYTQSIYMKKNRPAVKLSVICEEYHLSEMIDFILKETTTLGVRYNKLSRQVLERKEIKIKTKYGNVSVKLGYYNGKLLKYSPEYEECKVIAENFKMPIKSVYDDINFTTNKYLETFANRQI